MTSGEDAVIPDLPPPAFRSRCVQRLEFFLRFSRSPSFKMTTNWNVLTLSLLQYIILLSRIIFSQAVNIKCPEGGEFKHKLPMTSCRQYYICKLRSVEHHTCPPGTFYSATSKDCRVGGNCYDVVCTGRVNGRYADTTEGCKRWFECQGGLVETVESCPLGYHFSEQHNSCVPAADAACVNEKLTSVIALKVTNPCSGQTDGYYPVLGSRVYVKCVNQVEVETHSCPPNQKFNGWICSHQHLKDVCSSKNDGYHVAEDADDCSEYIHCQDRQIVSRRKCPGGTSFNGRSCEPHLLHSCVASKKDWKCRGLPNSFYPNVNNNCSSYFYCQDGELAAEESCPHELHWNGTQCAQRELFNCEESNESEDCLGRRGYIADVSSNCQKYHYCSYGRKITFRCPYGQVFNGAECVSSKDYKCQRIDQNSCNNKSPGYYTDTESNCRSYYYCANGHKIVYVCPPNDVFDGSKCVNMDEFKCPSPAHTECAGRPNGYQRVQRSLRDYIYCSDGVKLVTLHCEPNEVYDGEKCVNVWKYKSMCYNMKFGHITDSSCRVYYLCRDSSVIKSGVCLDTFVFDGKSCVPPLSGKCDRGSIKSCSGAPNGFYQDFNSDCKQYFYCINGQKTQLACPQGQVHNGDRCVSHHQYTCPSQAANMT